MKRGVEVGVVERERGGEKEWMCGDGKTEGRRRIGR
jgi:hypothetical protein